MTETGGTTKRHDDGNARHDDGDPRSWDGGAIVAQRGRSTLSIVVTGGGSLVRRRQQWEDLATSTSQWSIGSQRRGGYDDNDVNPRGDDDNDTTISFALATATRLAGDEEGDGGKSADYDTPISLVMATASPIAERAMATTKRVAGE